MLGFETKDFQLIQHYLLVYDELVYGHEVDNIRGWMFRKAIITGENNMKPGGIVEGDHN